MKLCFLPEYFGVIHKLLKKNVNIFVAELHRRHPEIGVTNQVFIF